MVGTHDADADDANTKRPVTLNGLHHVPPTPRSVAEAIPQCPYHAPTRLATATSEKCQTLLKSNSYNGHDGPATATAHPGQIPMSQAAAPRKSGTASRSTRSIAARSSR